MKRDIKRCRSQSVVRIIRWCSEDQRGRHIPYGKSCHITIATRVRAEVHKTFLFSWEKNRKKMVHIL